MLSAVDTLSYTLRLMLGRFISFTIIIIIKTLFSIASVRKHIWGYVLEKNRKNLVHTMWGVGGSKSAKNGIFGHFQVDLSKNSMCYQTITFKFGLASSN